MKLTQNKSDSFLMTKFLSQLLFVVFVLGACARAGMTVRSPAEIDTRTIRNVAVGKFEVGAEVALGGKADAGGLLLEGKALDARRQIEALSQNQRQAADWYNLGLAFEATAVSVEDYEDARRFYIEALDRDGTSRLYAQGVARTERYLADARTLKQQTAGTNNQ